MRVTFLLPKISLSGGIRSTLTIADQLSHRGHDVSIFIHQRKSVNVIQQAKSQLKSLLEGDIQAILNTNKLRLKKEEQEKAYIELVNLPIKEIDHDLPWQDDDLPDADAVIATWWADAEGFINLSPRKGAKLYFIRHHEVHDYLPVERVKATYRLPIYKVTTARWMADIMKSEYGSNQVFLIPNSVDTNLFNSVPRGKQPKLTVGLMYTETPWKGCDLSLEAFNLAAQRIPNLSLVAFGKHKQVPKLPLPQNAQFFYRPPQEEIKNIYASCDAWLFGSRVEGFGLPLLEAMACRTPVIGTPAGAAPELLAEGRGILVKPEDPVDMARAIESIYHMSDEDWQKMSEACYQKATSYTWADAAALLEQAIIEAIGQSKKLQS